MTRATKAFIALAPLAILAGCAPAYRMEPPAAFKRFERSGDFKLITADGVMLKAREVDNYPRADLPFWVDAMKRHLAERGYALKSEACFKTEKKLDGCTVDFLLPFGAEDWVLSETIFVKAERVVLVEVAGPFERYAKVEKDLAKALKTFDPGE
ncbi:MAG: hypothetical protein PHU25_17985 [Deltaproteobacteria bacterium]|nr:hypothetical protein [Deltaproteobacteria bacterium]